MNPYFQNQYTQPEQNPVNEQLAVAQQEFDADLMKLNSMQIVYLKLTETNSIKNYRRDKRLVMNDVTKERLEEDYIKYDSKAFNIANMVSNHNNIIQYGAEAKLSSIKGGWGKRYAFELVLRYNERFGQSIDIYDAFISGYTYGAEITLDGNLLSSTEFIVDNITVSLNGKFSEAFNVLTNPYGVTTIEIDYERSNLKEPTQHLYSMRPSDISVQVAANRHSSGGGATDNVIGLKPIESNSEHNNPLQGICESLELLAISKNTAQEFDNPYDIAVKSAMYSSEPSVLSIPFFAWLNKRQWDKVSNFTLEDLNTLFAELGRGGERYVSSMTKMFTTTKSTTATSIYDANENNGENILHSSAHMLIDSLQPLLKRFSINEINMTITNNTVNKAVVVTIENNHIIFKVNGIDANKTINMLSSEIRMNIFPLITKNRYNVSASLLINDMGARIDISIDGFGRDVISFSMYSYSTMSPVIGTYDEQNMSVQNVSTVSKEILGV